MVGISVAVVLVEKEVVGVSEVCGVSVVDCVSWVVVSCEDCLDVRVVSGGVVSAVDGVLMVVVCKVGWVVCVDEEMVSETVVASVERSSVACFVIGLAVEAVC